MDASQSFPPPGVTLAGTEPPTIAVDAWWHNGQAFDAEIQISHAGADAQIRQLTLRPRSPDAPLTRGAIAGFPLHSLIKKAIPAWKPPREGRPKRAPREVSLAAHLLAAARALHQPPLYYLAAHLYVTDHPLEPAPTIDEIRDAIVVRNQYRKDRRDAALVIAYEKAKKLKHAAAEAGWR